jgi:hypothetical protein
MRISPQAQDFRSRLQTFRLRRRMLRLRRENRMKIASGTEIFAWGVKQEK